MSTPPKRLDGGGERRRHRGLGGHVAVGGDSAVAQLRDRLGRSLGIEVERHDAGAGRRQRLDHRAPDAAGGAGHQRHLPLELAGRRRQRQLVELERPVLDGEALALVERHEAAQRMGAGHDLDRAVVEVAREPCRLGGGRDAHEPDVLDQHHARVRVGGLRGLVAVALDIRAVVLAEAPGEVADPRRQRVVVVRVRVERHPQGHALGVHEMVGARRADAGQLGGGARGHELEHPRRGVDHEHLRALARDRPAQRGQHGAQQLAPARVVERLAGRPVEALLARRARIDELDRAVDHLDRAAVCLVRRVAPHDEAVLGEHHELQPRVLPHRRPDLLGEREAGPDVGDPGRLVAEALGHQPLAVARPGEHVDAVRMRVMDVRGRHERVQQRLDRRARRRRVDLTAREVGDHVLVAHLVAVEHGERLVQAQRREVAAPHGREVAAGALDPHDLDLAADVVGRRPLRRRVAAAEVRHRAVGAEQVRGEQDLAERVAGNLARRRPAVLGRRDQLRERRHRPQPPATETVEPRSATMRST